MFNLTEAFKEGYEVYLQEKANEDFAEAFQILNESQKQAEASFAAVQKYFQLYALSEASMDPKSLPAENKKQTKQDESLSTDVFDTIRKIVELSKQSEKDTMPSYDAAQGFVSVKKISEMKFPGNIIFFIESLISWITNVVKRFISFFSNAIRGVFGLETTKDKFEDDLRLKLERVKKIENTVAPMNVGNVAKFMKIYSLSDKDLEKVGSFTRNESVLVEAGKDDMTHQPTKIGQPINVISIDVSKDMELLNQLLQHFVDLFDEAYGSNGEHLFKTDDLELLLRLFQATINDITKGTVSTYALSGKLTTMELLDSSKLRDNLIRTKLNTDNLKRAYQETDNKITDTLAMINQGLVLASSKLGEAFKYYSASTYSQMIDILQVLQPRIKSVEKIEKDMMKMKATFDTITIQLGKQRQAMGAFGQIAYTSVYQRKIDELFNSARFVSQTITLRLTVLGLYLKELKNVRESVKNVNAINQASKSVLKAFRF